VKTINLKLKHKVNEVFFLEPVDLGLQPLTKLYKMITHPLKTMPFIFIIPLSFLLAVVFYFLFGYLVVRLTSLLQYGF
jgi:hypothetical protein